MKGIECMIAVLGGVAVGATVAMLLTPCSGEEMRQTLCDMWRQCKTPCSCDRQPVDCNMHIKIDESNV